MVKKLSDFIELDSKDFPGTNDISFCKDNSGKEFVIKYAKPLFGTTKYDNNPSRDAIQKTELSDKLRLDCDDDKTVQKYIQNIAAIHEVLMSRLYNLFDVDTPNMNLVENDNGVLGVASEYRKGDKINLDEVKNVRGLRENFAIDCLLASHDVVGTNYPFDNVLNENGHAVRVDLGGGLLSRAHGDINFNKLDTDAKFGVPEIESFFKHDTYASQVFADMKPQEMEKGLNKIVAIDLNSKAVDKKIDDVFASVSDEHLPKVARDQLKFMLKSKLNQRISSMQQHKNDIIMHTIKTYESERVKNKLETIYNGDISSRGVENATKYGKDVLSFILQEQEKYGLSIDPNTGEVKKQNVVKNGVELVDELSLMVDEVYNKGMFKGNFDKKEEGHEARGLHGFGHGYRVGRITHELAAKANLSKRDTTIAVTFALFHDICRAADGKDLWDAESAALAMSFLEKQGFTVEELTPIFEQMSHKENITDKDAPGAKIALLVDIADSIEIFRCGYRDFHLDWVVKKAEKAGIKPDDCANIAAKWHNVLKQTGLPDFGVVNIVTGDKNLDNAYIKYGGELRNEIFSNNYNDNRHLKELKSEIDSVLLQYEASQPKVTPQTPAQPQVSFNPQSSLPPPPEDNQPPKLQPEVRPEAPALSRLLPPPPNNNQAPKSISQQEISSNQQSPKEPEAPRFDSQPPQPPRPKAPAQSPLPPQSEATRFNSRPPRPQVKLEALQVEVSSNQQQSPKTQPQKTPQQPEISSNQQQSPAPKEEPSSNQPAQSNQPQPEVSSNQQPPKTPPQPEAPAQSPLPPPQPEATRFDSRSRPPKTPPQPRPQQETPQQPPKTPQQETPQQPPKTLPQPSQPQPLSNQPIQNLSSLPVNEQIETIRNNTSYFNKLENSNNKNIAKRIITEDEKKLKLDFARKPIKVNINFKLNGKVLTLKEAFIKMLEKKGELKLARDAMEEILSKKITTLQEKGKQSLIEGFNLDKNETNVDKLLAKKMTNQVLKEIGISKDDRRM
ncbi:MAG: hypothetical protein Ta2D_04580 [Rickettsiales bacterium]|nr:MAG: hypothetical protein Ta2D_04580 [Rickettsiales bacterium]